MKTSSSTGQSMAGTGPLGPEWRCACPLHARRRARGKSLLASPHTDLNRPLARRLKRTAGKGQLLDRPIYGRDRPTEAGVVMRVLVRTHAAASQASRSSPARNPS